MNNVEKIKQEAQNLHNEPVSIDFEQELYKAFGQVKDFTLGMRIAKWFYDMGTQRQKEQMMAKAVDGTLIEGDLIRQEGITHPSHSGEKVKLVIIKED